MGPLADWDARTDILAELDRLVSWTQYWPQLLNDRIMIYKLQVLLNVGLDLTDCSTRDLTKTD